MQKLLHLTGLSQNSEGQKERRELLPLEETRDMCLCLLAVIDTVAIYRERTNIPPRQKNVCLHCTTNVKSLISPILQEWAFANTALISL